MIIQIRTTLICGIGNLHVFILFYFIIWDDSDLILWETKKTLKNFPNVKEREKDILDLPNLYLQQKFNGFFPEPLSEILIKHKQTQMKTKSPFQIFFCKWRGPVHFEMSQ